MTAVVFSDTSAIPGESILGGVLVVDELLAVHDKFSSARQKESVTVNMPVPDVSVVNIPLNTVVISPPRSVVEKACDSSMEAIWPVVD
jgi:hypothetical protein